MCCSELSRSVMSNSLQPMDCRPPGSLCPWNSPGKNSPCSPPEDFLTQGSNEVLPHCRQILCHLSHQGSPRTQEWVIYPSPENRPDPGIKQNSALQGNSLPAELPGKPISTYKNI